MLRALRNFVRVGTRPQRDSERVLDAAWLRNIPRADLVGFPCAPGLKRASYQQHCDFLFPTLSTFNAYANTASREAGFSGSKMFKGGMGIIRAPPQSFPLTNIAER